MAPVVDAYGFALEVSVSEQSDRLECAKQAAKQAKRWAKIDATKKLPPQAALKRLCRKGIPVKLRPWVWLDVSGASTRRAQHPDNYYQNMVVAGQRSSFLRQVDLDVPRTHPGHPWMQSAGGQQSLRSVLLAFCAHNQQLGYCQSMNYVAGLLLLAMDKREEDAFWTFTCLVENILYPGTYSSNLTGCHVEMRSLNDLLVKKQNELYQHLQQTSCDISIIATDWFLCLFSTSLPPESTARVWDALFVEGTKVLHRVALAILKISKEVLLTKDNPGELSRAVREAAQHMHHHGLLMATAFKGIGSMPMKKIDKFREVEQVKVDEMLAEREATRRRQDLKAAIEQRKREMDAEEAARDAALEGSSGGAVKAAAAAAEAAARSLWGGLDKVVSTLKDAPAALQQRSTSGRSRAVSDT